MQIPLIPKDPSRSDLNCRDGEIDFHVRVVETLTIPSSAAPRETVRDWSALARGVRFSFAAVPLQPWTVTDTDSPEASIRIPLKAGEKEKAVRLLSGDPGLVDAETAERLTAEIGSRAATVLDSMACDAADASLFLAPFRAYTQIRFPDGAEGFPSAQAVMLPFTSPPHPEFTAVSVTDDTLTVALRFPLKFHALEAIAPEGLPSGCGLRTYVSKAMPLPDSKNCRGSIGSVRTASGATARGFRFDCLSASSIKASVTAPSEHYLFSGGKVSQTAATAPDYLHHTPILKGTRQEYGATSIILAPSFGDFPSFAKDAFTAVETDTDPLDWITDWKASGAGLVPASIPSAWIDASEQPSMILTSRHGCPDVFPVSRRHAVGEGRLIALAEALRPVSSGQLGEFPLYAFSEEGVWALKSDVEAGYVPAQKLGRHRLAAPHLACPYLTGVAFITAHGLYGAEGNKIKPLSLAFKADADECDGMEMHYDEKGDRLVITSESGTAFHEFSADASGQTDNAEGASAYAASDVSDLSQVWPPGMDRTDACAWLENSGHTCLMLTRPLSLSGDIATCHRATATEIRRLQVCGLPADGAPVAAILYGTQDGSDYRPLRLFDPRRTTIARTLPHLRYRLLLTSTSPLPSPLLLRIN